MELFEPRMIIPLTFCDYRELSELPLIIDWREVILQFISRSNKALNFIIVPARVLGFDLLKFSIRVHQKSLPAVVNGVSINSFDNERYDRRKNHDRRKR